MVTDDQLRDMEMKLGASLRRTGANFILVWLLAIGMVWLAADFRQLWLLVTATVLLVVLFFMVCIPNIGRVVALNRIYGGMLGALRKQVVLADIGAVVVLYPIAAIWWQFPLPTLSTIGAFVVAYINSQAGGGDV